MLPSIYFILKRKNILILMLTAFLAVPGIFVGCSAGTGYSYEPPAFVISDSLPEEKQEKLREGIEQIFRENGGFSGVILVMQSENVIISEAFGITDFESESPNTIYTPFSIRYMTKIFTGAAILLLELDGKLDTSDTLDNFFNGHDNLEDVTVGDLLTMSARFGGYTPHLRMFVSEPDEVREMTALDLEPYVIKYWRGVALNPYASMDFWLLGRIIEQVSGMSYEEFIRTRIFEAAGMENSGFIGRYEMAMPLTIPFGYQDTWESMMSSEAFPFFIYYSIMGIVSSANDLNLWLSAFFGGELFPKYMLEQINNDRFNYGWVFQSGIWRRGGTGGPFGSHIIYDFDSDTRIIVLSNFATENREANYLARVIAEVLLDIQIQWVNL